MNDRKGSADVLRFEAADVTGTHRVHVLSGLGTWRLVFDGRYKLIGGYGETGKPILFDLLNDPMENEDIAGQAEAEVTRLSRVLGI